MSVQLCTFADGIVDEVFAYGHYADGVRIAFVRLPAFDGCPPLEVAIPLHELHVKHKKTPAGNPAVGAAGDEGQNQSNTHEGASSL